MPLQVTGRHTEVSQSDRDYLEKKVPRLERLCGKLDELAVVFIAEKKEHIVEINLHAGHIHAFTKGKGDTSKAALDRAIDKLQSQVAKEREKKFGNKLHATESIRSANEALSETSDEDQD